MEYAFQKKLQLSEFLNALEFELHSMHRFIQKVPDVCELAEADLRSLLLRNFFPMIAVKHAFRWAEVK